MEKLASVLHQSVKLRPAYHAYHQQCRLAKVPMRFVDLANMVRDAVEHEREQVNNQVLERPSGRKVKDPLSPAGPAPEVSDVLRRNLGFCQKYVVGLCKDGDACRYKHTPVPAVDAAEFKRACSAKYAGASGDNASESGSLGSEPGSQKRGIGLCRNWEASVHCPNMPNCRFRHGESAEELARVKALRAKEKGKGKGKGKGSSAKSDAAAVAMLIGRPSA